MRKNDVNFVIKITLYLTLKIDIDSKLSVLACEDFFTKQVVKIETIQKNNMRVEEEYAIKQQETSRIKLSL